VRVIRHFAVGIACSCALAGCSTNVIAVRPLPPREEASLNDLVRPHQTRLTLAPPLTSLDARDFRLEGNMAYFQKLDPAMSASSPVTSVPLPAVQRLEFRDHGRGAVHGLGFGALTGVAAGIVVGLAVPWSCDNDCTGAFTAISALVGAGAFGLLGAGLGSAIGAPTTVEFSDMPRH